MKYLYAVIFSILLAGCSSKVITKEDPSDFIKSNWYILFSDKSANNYYFWKKEDKTLFEYEPYHGVEYLNNDKNITKIEYQLNPKELEELKNFAESLKQKRELQVKSRIENTTLLIIKTKTNFVNRYIFKSSKEVRDFEMFISQFRFKD